MSSDAFVVAILRGGALRPADSILSGYGALDSLARMSIPTVDVYIDEQGVWHTKGVVTEPHMVFSRIDGYVDTTEDLLYEHQDLARRMGVKKLLWDFSDDEYHADRETVYRLLRQKNIVVPDTKVVRVRGDENTPELSYLQDIWKTVHTPYLLRPLKKTPLQSSVLIGSFDDFLKKADEYKAKGLDFQVISYKDEPTISTAVMPKYRGEDLYVPLSVTTLVGKRETPTNASKIILYKTQDKEYGELKELLTRVYDALLLKDPALIDVIKTPQGFVVVEVQTKPSLKEEGRFMKSLRSTGVEIGHYIVNLFEKKE